LKKGDLGGFKIFKRKEFMADGIAGEEESDA
jgi:hypothetical protein